MVARSNFDPVMGIATGVMLSMNLVYNVPITVEITMYKRNFTDQRH
jgi:hypothetical protein